jgi:hypothetical protein
MYAVVRYASIEDESVSSIICIENNLDIAKRTAKAYCEENHLNDIRFSRENYLNSDDKIKENWRKTMEYCMDVEIKDNILWGDRFENQICNYCYDESAIFAVVEIK